MSTDNISIANKREKSRRKKPAPDAASAAANGLVALMSEFGSSYVRWVRSLLPEGTSLTVPRAALLGVLAAKGERILMGELGELLGVSPRNVTVIVDGLEHEKLVTRVAHERDRRATFVEITPAGKEVAAQVLAPHQNRVAGLFDTALTASECAQSRA